MTNWADDGILIFIMRDQLYPCVLCCNLAMVVVQSSAYPAVRRETLTRPPLLAVLAADSILHHFLLDHLVMLDIMDNIINDPKLNRDILTRREADKHTNRHADTIRLTGRNKDTDKLT